MADAHISTILREYVTAAGIVVGGGWALWRWGFEERLRRHRDFPALDGSVVTSGVKIPNGRVIVTVKALWRNRGKLPVEIDPSTSAIALFRLTDAVQEGVLTERSPGVSPLPIVRPLADCSAYTLEPLTDSPIETVFVFEKDEVILFHWILCTAEKQTAYPYLSSPFSYTRWCVWDPASVAKSNSE